MPEGHTIHRLALDHKAILLGKAPRVSSPQGKFLGGAALIDGLVIKRIEPYGKHLWYHFGSPGGETRLLHVHLGLFGKWTSGALPAAEPRGALRMRLTTDEHWLDLRGPTMCAVETAADRDAVLARLGPDPLRSDADGALAYARISRSRVTIGALLMNQEVLCGVGNVFRAEVLYRASLSPFLLGRDLPERLWDDLWQDLRTLLQAGVRANRIVTTERADRAQPTGTARRVDAHYVYRRHGQPCRRCGTEIRTEVMAARNLFWCPTCQPA